MNILPYNEITASFHSSRQNTLSASSSDFKRQFTSYRIKAQIKDRIQSKRNEMQNRFQGLTERKWSRMTQDSDVESVNSYDLYQLAGSLMAAGTQSVIQREDGKYYTVNPVTGELCSYYPGYGIRRLEYDYLMMQKAYEMYKSYNTDEEQSKLIRPAEDKTDFLEFMKLLASYREEINS